MTSPSLGRLLISHITLRGPELRHLYSLIHSAPGIAYDELIARLVLSDGTEDPFGLRAATVREALNFLLVAKLISQQGTTRHKAAFRSTPLLTDVAFPLLLLHHIDVLTDDRQRSLVLIQRHLVARDLIAISPSALRDEIERGPYGRLFAWTNEKIAFWAHLAANLGLVRQLARDGEVLVVPQPNLIYAALWWSARRLGHVAGLDTHLKAIDTAFFACFAGRGRVHCGLAQTLLAMHQFGSIELLHQSDAERSVLLGDRRVSAIRLLQGEEAVS